jgi:hypothetical protein
MKTMMKIPPIPHYSVQGRMLMALPDAQEAVAYGVPREKIGVVLNEDGDWVAMEALEPGQPGNS